MRYDQFVRARVSKEDLAVLKRLAEESGLNMSAVLRLLIREKGDERWHVGSDTERETSSSQSGIGG